MEFQISLLVALALATYISKKAFRSPNPVPENRYHKDSLVSSILGRIGTLKLREYTIFVFSILHIIVTANYINLEPSLFCPHPEHLNEAYFTWTPYAKTCIIFICVFGTVRLYIYSTLGKSFTFELAKPPELVTTGIYAYAQHPSYIPDFLLSFANIALFANFDGAFGCFLPLVLVDLWAQFQWLIMLGFTLAYWKVLTGRIRDEEEMLEEAFGDEWRKWHRKTARLIPGVF
jgi:protein-S-isoprenylcysteine O-methyltransferase Ste14